jgi:hypothetical protein
MKTWLHQKMAESLRRCVDEKAAQQDKRLCCENTGVKVEHAANFFLALIAAWRKELVLVLSYRGSSVGGRVVDMATLAGILQESVDKQAAVTVVDMTTMDGVTLDCNGGENAGEVELTIIAWGQYEHTALEASQKWGVSTFRGN